MNENVKNLIETFERETAASFADTTIGPRMEAQDRADAALNLLFEADDAGNEIATAYIKNVLRRVEEIRKSVV